MSSRQKNKHATGASIDGQIALVLQGGGALGAYQAGVYETLRDAGYEPNWVAGISIGSINAAIIAGNAPEDRVPRLKDFWHRVTADFPWAPPRLGNEARRLFNNVSASMSMMAGQSGFFKSRIPPSALRPNGSPGALSVYDTSPLYQTLLELIDFDRINHGKMRLSLGSTNVRSGNFVYFDSAKCEITPLHVMASGALPPGFPSIEIDGEAYWDGGLVSNTPLSYVLEVDAAKDTLVFQIDLFSSRGNLPQNLLEVEQRRKAIVYSSRTRLNTDHFREKHELRRAISKLFDSLPPDVKLGAEFQALQNLGKQHAVSIVHFVYHNRPYEGGNSDYEFSRASMEDHWEAGSNAARQTLKNTAWRTFPDEANGVEVFDALADHYEFNGN